MTDAIINNYQIIRGKLMILKTTTLAAFIVAGSILDSVVSVTLYAHETEQVGSENVRLITLFEEIFERNVANNPNDQTRLGLKTKR
jgi:hypothetical protein